MNWVGLFTWTKVLKTCVDQRISLAEPGSGWARWTKVALLDLHERSIFFCCMEILRRRDEKMSNVRAGKRSY